MRVFVIVLCGAVFFFIYSLLSLRFAFETKHLIRLFESLIASLAKCIVIIILAFMKLSSH